MQADFIECYDQALSPDLCRAVIDQFESSDRKAAGQTGQGVDKSKKNSIDLTITGIPEWQDLHKQIQKSTLSHLMLYIRKYPFVISSSLGLSVQNAQSGQVRALTAEDIASAPDEKLRSFVLKVLRPGTINVQKYSRNVGGYYYWHSEIYPRDPACETLHRVLLFMFYLNDVDQGGETEFWYQERKLKPTMGQMVIAPAGFTHTHRGNIPESHDKYILTSWILFNRAEQLYKPST